MVQDVGAEAASSSGGLVRLAACRERERDVHRVLGRGMKLTLPLAKTYVGPDNDKYPVLSLREWANFLVQKNCFHITAGLLRPDPDRQAAIFQKFWEIYRETHPSHDIYKMSAAGEISLAHTCPVLYHGDEGRGRRKAGFMVGSYVPLLGRGLGPALAKQKRLGIKKSYLKLKPNFLGHVYTNRFLHCALPKKAYMQEPIFRAVLDHAAQEAVRMCTEGVLDKYSGQRYYMMIINVIGDWPWLIKAGDLSRSFQNVGKGGGTEGKDPIGICHWCQAGQINYDFEQVHTRTPAWLSTMHQDPPFLRMPSFLRVPHECDKDAAFFMYDLWHSFHLGIGKNLVASILARWSDFQPGRGVDERIAWVSNHFMQWCRDNQKTPYISGLSKEKLNWNTRKEYPCGTWHKGAVTTTICEYLESQASDLMMLGDSILAVSAEAVVSANKFLRILYESDLFLNPQEAVEAGNEGLRFLRRYGRLASASLSQGLSLFGLTPKAHVIHHLSLNELYLPGLAGKACANPVSFSAQMCEDFIGRPSRISRRVHPARVSERCITRVLEASYQKYIEAGYLIARPT